MIEPTVWCALHDLTAEYWRRVDRVSALPVDDLYAENGQMQIGSLCCEGREKIRAFFVERNAKEVASERTTRHCTSLLAIEALGHDRYRIHSTVQVFAGIGTWPLSSSVPATIGDFEDIASRSHDGRWRFESRTARIVFTGSGAAPFTR